MKSAQTSKNLFHATIIIWYLFDGFLRYDSIYHGFWVWVVTKNTQILNYASFYIEKFYTDLLKSDDKILNISTNNYSKILNQINLIKKFNLNDKNSFIVIKNILKNEAK